jgi:hypothetical protein
MAHKEDYIPSGDVEYNRFFKNILDYVDEKTGGSVPEWTFIPPGDLTELHKVWNEWDTAYQKILVPHTPVDTAGKNRARGSSEKALREFINHFLRYPPVTPEDRANMGIPEKDTTHTPVPIPHTRPEFNITVKDIRLLSVSFKDQGSASKAKPYGINGAVISWAVLDAPPADEKALNNTMLATRTPHVLEFTEEERGKTVYIALQWQNEKGERGRHSEIQSAIIP